MRKDLAKKPLFFNMLLMMSSIMSGCGPSAVQVATMTAAAWTATPTFTRYTLSGFSVTFPKQWRSVDVEKDGIQSILDTLKGLNSNWAQSTAAKFSAEALQKDIKLWAMDAKPAGSGYASADVSLHSISITMNSADVCVQMPLVYKPSGAELVDARCGLKINELDFDRFTIRLQLGSLEMEEYQYVYVEGRNLWVLTFSVDETQWAKYEPVFITTAESFRITK